jgi:hypothetical protein
MTNSSTSSTDRCGCQLHRESDRCLGHQQARQLTWTLTGRSTPLCFLIRARDSKFTPNFDTVLQSEGIESPEPLCAHRKRTRSPNALSARSARECLDWLLILNRRHLERVLRVFVHRYNGHRPHRSLNLTPPDPVQAILRSVSSPRPITSNVESASAD